MTEDWTGFDTLLGTAWYNTEYRIFEFLPVSPIESIPLFSIRETEWSRLRRQEGAEELKLSDTGKEPSGNAENTSAGRPDVVGEVNLN